MVSLANRSSLVSHAAAVLVEPTSLFRREAVDPVLVDLVQQQVDLGLAEQVGARR
jgi:hypothetical protein